MQKLSLFSGGWWRRLRAWVAMFQTAWTAIHTPSSSPNSTEQFKDNKEEILRSAPIRRVIYQWSWVLRSLYWFIRPKSFVCPHFEGQLHLSIWVPGKGWIYIIYFYYYAKYFQTGDPGRLNDGPAWDGHSAECKEDETGPPTLCSCQQAR